MFEIPYNSNLQLFNRIYCKVPALCVFKVGESDFVSQGHYNKDKKIDRSLVHEVQALHGTGALRSRHDPQPLHFIARFTQIRILPSKLSLQH